MMSIKKTNQKGFSLVELLIVIAIMGVLAVIAFNAFGSVLQNSRRRADDAQADNLQRALTLLIQETGIPNIRDTQNIEIDDDHNGTIDTSLHDYFETDNNETGHEDIIKLVKALQGFFEVKDRATGRTLEFGPYLNNPLEGGADPLFDPFAPQWNPDTGGRNVSFRVDINTSTQNVVVQPVMEDEDDDITDYDPNDHDAIDDYDFSDGIKPGIFINDN